MLKKILLGIGVLLLLFILFIIFAPAPATTPGSETSDTSTDMKTYTNESYGFSMEYPEDWSYTEANASSVVTINSPKQSSSDVFSENVNVVVQTLPPDMTLAMYAEKSMKDLNTYVGNFDLMEQKDVTIAGQPGKRLVYQGVYPGQENEYKFLQEYVVKDGSAYLLTYTAVPAEFDTFVSQAEVILASFSLQ